MKNAEIAALFDKMADALELGGENRFRINSYRKAARAIGDLTEDIYLQRIVLVIIHAAETPGPLDFQQILARKHAENAANSALLTLVNTHIRQNAPHADLADILEQAYLIAAQQMDIPNYLSQAMR